MTAPAGQIGIFIPPLGTKLKLAENWTFVLHDEYRNETLRELHGLKTEYRGSRDAKITIPAGTELVVDRIYIRKGAGDFDSVTFRMPGKKVAGKQVNRVDQKFVGYKLDGVLHSADSYYKLPWERREKAEIVYEEFPWVEKIPTKGVRFWAKLEDVNKMWAEVVP